MYGSVWEWSVKSCLALKFYSNYSSVNLEALGSGHQCSHHRQPPPPGYRGDRGVLHQLVFTGLTGGLTRRWVNRAVGWLVTDRCDRPLTGDSGHGLTSGVGSEPAHWCVCVCLCVCVSVCVRIWQRYTHTHAWPGSGAAALGAACSCRSAR